jgi:E3 ubiquitin-protein ligase DOA10
MKELLSPYETNKDLQEDIREAVEKTSFERTDIQSLTKDSEKVHEVLENIQGGCIAELHSETQDFLMLIHSDVLENIKYKDQELQNKSQILLKKSELIESGIAEAKHDMEKINSLQENLGRDKLRQDYQKQINFYQIQLEKIKSELNEISIEIEKNQVLFENESRKAFLLVLGASSFNQETSSKVNLYKQNSLFTFGRFEGHIKEGKIYDSKKSALNPNLVGRLREQGNQTMIEVYDKDAVMKKYSRVGRISEDGVIYAGNSSFSEKRIGSIEEDSVYMDGTYGRFDHKKIGYAKEK